MITLCNKVNIWEGVYPSFEEAPHVGKGFQDKKILLAKSKEFQNRFKSSRSKAIGTKLPCYSNSLLPVVIAMLNKGASPLSVLDFGGGFGNAYLQMKSAITTNLKLKYFIVDLPEVCEKGRELNKEYKDLFYASDVPSNFKADIVHFGSSLHYINDWRELLRKYSNHCTQYLLLTDLTVGEIPTYVTVQTYHDSRIPVWFWNIGYFVRTVENLGFEMVLRSDYGFNLDCKVGLLPQDNFDIRYRIGKTSHLLFKKKLMG